LLSGKWKFILLALKKTYVVQRGRSGPHWLWSSFEMQLILASSVAACLAVATASSAQLPAATASAAQLPADDAVRVHEFYRLATQIEDGIWPGWSKVADPVLLVTSNGEFLTHFPSTPAGFQVSADGFVTRPRKLDTHFQATLPIFGPPAVILVGEPGNTASKTSTPWLIMLMHEHFHQMQDAQPGYWDAVNALGLSHGDQSGMWMLNYPFPYTDPEIARSFAQLRDQLLVALSETDGREFDKAAHEYFGLRRQFFAKLSPEDHKYLGFQLWQEGMARYTEIKAAEAADDYEPTPAYRALADYESFSAYAKKARSKTIEELRQVDIAKAQRVAVYPFGAAEGLLLDRLDPKWKLTYFKHLLSTDALFDVSTR
jgi:hypothetical protein